MRKSRGFTLVELLVVIGIIAVLISILLPSLAKARQYANSIMCASNLRSVGQGLLFYANDHKGKLPMSGAGGPPANGEGWFNQWPAQVSLQMGTDLKLNTDAGGVSYGNFTGDYSPILRCPDAPTEFIGNAWNGSFHYTANCRAMPRAGTVDRISDPDGSLSYKLKSYPLATANAASKMLVWDGPLLSDFGWNACTDNTNQWWWYITWGFATDGSKWGNLWADPFAYPGPNMTDIANADGQGAYNSGNPSSAAWIGLGNRDGGPGEMPWTNDKLDSQRYRHLGNTSGNFLFFDGHVEARKIGEVTFGDLSCYAYH